MSIDAQIAALLATGTMTIDELARVVGASHRLIKLRVSNMQARGKARIVGDVVHADNRPVKPRKAKKVRSEPTPPPASEQMDCALWLDGSLTIRPAHTGPDGSALLTPDEAKALFDFLSRALTKASAGEEQPSAE